MDFSQIFIFEPPDFFVDFLAGFFLLIFVGKKCPEKASRKIPGKILQILYNKNPSDTFLQIGRGKNITLTWSLHLEGGLRPGGRGVAKCEFSGLSFVRDD